MVKSSVAEMMKGSEEGATQVPSGQRRRAARGRRGAAESTDVSPAETTPMPATDTSTRLQVSGAVGEGTSEAVARSPSMLSSSTPRSSLRAAKYLTVSFIFQIHTNCLKLLGSIGIFQPFGILLFKQLHAGIN